MSLVRFQPVARKLLTKVRSFFLLKSLCYRDLRHVLSKKILVLFLPSLEKLGRINKFFGSQAKTQTKTRTKSLTFVFVLPGGLKKEFVCVLIILLPTSTGITLFHSLTRNREKEHLTRILSLRITALSKLDF